MFAVWNINRQILAKTIYHFVGYSYWKLWNSAKLPLALLCAMFSFQFALDQLFTFRLWYLSYSFDLSPCRFRCKISNAFGMIECWWYWFHKLLVQSFSVCGLLWIFQFVDDVLAALCMIAMRWTWLRAAFCCGLGDVCSKVSLVTLHCRQYRGFCISECLSDEREIRYFLNWKVSIRTKMFSILTFSNFDFETRSFDSRTSICCFRVFYFEIRFPKMRFGILKFDLRKCNFEIR